METIILEPNKPYRLDFGKGKSAIIAGENIFKAIQGYMDSLPDKSKIFIIDGKVESNPEPSQS